MADVPTTVAATLATASQRDVGSPAAGKTEADAKKAAKEFEGVFLSEMFGTMFEGIPTDGPFGGGPGEGMMRSMLVDEYSKSVAARGGVGIADNVYRELIQIQEAQNGGPKSK